MSADTDSADTGHFPAHFPPIGSEKWCSEVDDMIGTLALQGKIMLDNFDELLAFLKHMPRTPPSWYSASFGSLPFGLGKAFMELYRAPVETWNTFVSLMHGVRTLQIGVAKTVGCDNPNIAIYLSLVRAALRAFSRVRVGTDLGLWATIDLDVRYDAAEAALERLINYVCPKLPPSAGEAMDCYRKGLITEDIYNCWMRINDCIPEVYFQPLAAGRPRLSPEQAILYSRLTDQNPDAIGRYLHLLGYDPASESQHLQYLYDKPASPEELQTAYNATRDSAAYIADRQLDGEEFAIYWERNKDVLKAHGVTEAVARKRWYVTRHKPGLQERMTMLHRLRPGAPGVTAAYTEDDFSFDLLTDPTPPYWRERQKELRYIPYTLREIRQMLDAGQMTEEEVRNAFMDMGYDADKALAQAKMEMVLTARRRKSEIQGWTPARAAMLYKQKAIDASRVRRIMADLSYTEEQADELIEVADLEAKGRHTDRLCEQSQTENVNYIKTWYLAGIMGEEDARTKLVNAGATSECADSIIASWDAATKLRYLNAAVSAIKKGWLSGFTSDANAESVLQHAGMIRNAAEKTVAEWRGQEVVDQRMLSVQEVLAGVKDGRITTAVATARLTLMGYAPSEAQILILTAHDALTAAEQKQAVARGRSATQTAKAAEQLIRRAEAAEKTARAALKQLTPLGSLKTWLKKGIIGEDQFRERMERMGYTESVIAAHIKEICDAKGAACVQSADNPIATTGVPGSSSEPEPPVTPSSDGSLSG